MTAAESQACVQLKCYTRIMYTTNTLPVATSVSWNKTQNARPRWKENVANSS